MKNIDRTIALISNRKSKIKQEIVLRIFGCVFHQLYFFHFAQ